MSENFKIEKLEEKYVDDVFLIEKTFFGLNDASIVSNSIESETLSYYVMLDKKEKVVGEYEISNQTCTGAVCSRYHIGRCEL